MLLRPIRYLKAVADHGSFTRAASALHVSQPALSQQIREFEERMGVQMLDRSGRQVRPTDAGEVYLRHVRRALDELEVGGRAIRDVQDLSSGTLRLGFTPSFAIYLLAPLIRRYRDRFPGIVLTVTEMAQEEMERAVSADALDVGLAFTDVLAQDVEWLPLHKERLSSSSDKSIRPLPVTGRWTRQRWLPSRSPCLVPPSQHESRWIVISAGTAFSPMWRWRPIRSPPSWRSSVSPG
jgi:LysR family cyn operon transcriptional activator